MKKQLIYYFYFRSDWCTKDVFVIPEVYLIHIECIKEYGKNFFNKMTLILTFDSINPTTNYIKQYFIEQFKDYCEDIEIKIDKNYPEFREGIYFYKEIMCKMDEYDGLICWGHGKQDFDYSKPPIYNWITLCHYINSKQFVKDNIEEKFNNDSKYFYGPILTNSWAGLFYGGSFYWLYPKHIIADKENNFLLIKEKIDYICENLLNNTDYDYSKFYKTLREISESFVTNFTIKNCLHSQNNIFKLFGKVITPDNYQVYFPTGDPYCYDNDDYIYYQNVYSNEIMNNCNIYRNNIFNKFNIDLKDDTVR